MARHIGRRAGRSAEVSPRLPALQKKSAKSPSTTTGQTSDGIAQQFRAEQAADLLAAKAGGGFKAEIEQVQALAAKVDIGTQAIAAIAEFEGLYPAQRQVRKEGRRGADWIAIDDHAEMFGQIGERVGVARRPGLLQGDNVGGGIGNDVQHPVGVELDYPPPATAGCCRS